MAHLFLLYSSGVTYLLLAPEEFIERLVVLIPPPRTHLVRWAGVFAPHSPYRREITLHPEVKKGFQFREDDDDSDAQPLRNYSWSKMLAKVFKIDVTTCDARHGRGGRARRSIITSNFTGLNAEIIFDFMDLNPQELAEVKSKSTTGTIRLESTQTEFSLSVVP